MPQQDISPEVRKKLMEEHEEVPIPNEGKEVQPGFLSRLGQTVVSPIMGYGQGIESMGNPGALGGGALQSFIENIAQHQDPTRAALASSPVGSISEDVYNKNYAGLAGTGAGIAALGGLSRASGPVSRFASERAIPVASAGIKAAAPGLAKAAAYGGLGAGSSIVAGSLIPEEFGGFKHAAQFAGGYIPMYQGVKQLGKATGEGIRAMREANRNISTAKEMAAEGPIKFDPFDQYRSEELPPTPFISPEELQASQPLVPDLRGQSLIDALRRIMQRKANR